MNHIRVVWKDAPAFKKVASNYRRHTVQGYGKGWITNIEGDDNIYKTRFCAMNAIDKALGSEGRMGTPENRKAHGIRIIGKKSEEAGETA